MRVVAVLALLVCYLNASILDLRTDDVLGKVVIQKGDYVIVRAGNPVINMLGNKAIHVIICSSYPCRVANIKRLKRLYRTRGIRLLTIK